VVENRPPVIVTNKLVTANESADVILDASGSTDVEGTALSFDWIQTQGTTVALDITTEATLQFISPRVGAEQALTFELTISDGVYSTTAQVNFTLPQVTADAVIELSVTVTDSQLSETNTTTFTVANKVDLTPEPPKKSSSGSMGYWVWLMMASIKTYYGGKFLGDSSATRNDGVWLPRQTLPRRVRPLRQPPKSDVQYSRYAEVIIYFG
jgi:hypothetical protein